MRCVQCGAVTGVYSAEPDELGGHEVTCSCAPLGDQVAAALEGLYYGGTSQLRYGAAELHILALLDRWRKARDAMVEEQQ